MPERAIRLFGDPVLAGVAAPITRVDDRVRALVKDLLDTVRVPGRAGVAAPQIGVSLRAFSYHVGGEVGYLINPVLVEKSDETHLVDEGCLSVPEQWHPTRRSIFARASGMNLAGDEVVIEGHGLMAQMLQHEIDHLEGTVYLGRLEPAERKRAMQQVRQSAWFSGR